MAFNYQLRNQSYFIFFLMTLAQEIIEQNTTKNPKVKSRKYTDLLLQRYHTGKPE